ncbi:MFS transporter [Helicovermis profundi]|uniref:MFS transporter n=2 Tax=Helicovermis profundi TaxID=3065157 RepID=A0AAU9E0D5_9FIRM|nr:MFS transporter [Clostridia bacterium S502]
MKDMNYIKLLSAIIINSFGDILFDLFIVWSITVNSGDVMNAVYLIGGSILFRALLSMFIGILIDRYSKKLLMIISNISSVVVISALFLFLRFELSTLWIGIFFILINDINNEIFRRGYVAISAEIFEESLFIKFQSSYSVIVKVLSIGGSVIVGLMITYMSQSLIFSIDILTFIIAIVLVYQIKSDKIYVIKEKEKLKIKEFSSIYNTLISEVKVAFTAIFKVKFLKQFVILMFVLNLAYGYIPYILPVILSSKINSALFLGFIKAGIAVGEIIGLILVVKFGNNISLLFKFSMIGCIISIVVVNFIDESIIIVLGFSMYGFSDSLTQPLFSHTVSSLDDKDRGKILGGIDTIILLSPSLGMFIGTFLQKINMTFSVIFLVGVFLFGYFIISNSREFKNININKAIVRVDEKLI